MGDYSKWVKTMGTREKINTVWWTIKINLQKLVHICRYELPTNLQNFTQNDLTKVKIFQKVLGWGLLFFWNTVYLFRFTSSCLLFCAYINTTVWLKKTGPLQLIWQLHQFIHFTNYFWHRKTFFSSPLTTIKRVFKLALNQLRGFHNNRNDLTPEHQISGPTSNNTSLAGQ